MQWKEEIPGEEEFWCCGVGALSFMGFAKAYSETMLLNTMGNIGYWEMYALNRWCYERCFGMCCKSKSQSTYGPATLRDPVITAGRNWDEVTCCWKSSMNMNLFTSALATMASMSDYIILGLCLFSLYTL